MRARHIITAIALVFFSLPIALRVVGVQAKQFENHAFAPAPKLSQGWDLFPQTTQFFTDRMPLREQAITADRRLSEDVFGTSPTYGVRDLPGAPGGDPAATANLVTRGRSGWLYSTESLRNSCKANRPVTIAQANHAWGRLRDVLERRVDRVVIVVVPEKDTIYPEFLPDTFSQKDCLPQDRDELWRGIDTAGKDFLPLRRTLTAAKQQNRQLIYIPKDTHWNGLGANYLPREVLKVLGGNVQMNDRDLHVGSITRIGDLDATRNPNPEKALMPVVRITRDPGAPKVRGQTVLLGDSFSLFFGDNMQAYFANYRRIDWNTVQTLGNARSTAATARGLARANTVIIEVGERHYLQMAEPIGTEPRPSEILVPKIDYLTASLERAGR